MEFLPKMQATFLKYIGLSLIMFSFFILLELLRGPSAAWSVYSCIILGTWDTCLIKLYLIFLGHQNWSTIRHKFMMQVLTLRRSEMFKSWVWISLRKELYGLLNKNTTETLSIMVKINFCHWYWRGKKEFQMDWRGNSKQKKKY